ncbi:MBL fold metallo-hydrolase [Luteibacter sp. NPDC031894]|uniref:MBL fold metallo-hydrolase n=1 Tax=Luteibacter sp. NPDC031894 TaxID=3390572 RepID=UPI003CFE1A42
MRPSRQLRNAVCLLLLGTAPIVPHTACAGVPQAKLDREQAGYFRFKLGKVDVIALSDGTVTLDLTKELSNPTEAARVMTRKGVKLPLDVSVNAFLILLDKKVILVDAGAGELFGPTLNKLTSSLRAAGMEPDQVTDILVTHIHPDHTGGLAVGGQKVFANAVIHVSKKELAFWMDKAAADKAEEPTRTFFKGVDQTLGPYLATGKVKTFESGEQLFPGIRTLPGYGHTPGQSYFVLEDAGKKNGVLGRHGACRGSAV